MPLRIFKLVQVFYVTTIRGFLLTFSWTCLFKELCSFIVILYNFETLCNRKCYKVYQLIFLNWGNCMVLVLQFSGVLGSCGVWELCVNCNCTIKCWLVKFSLLVSQGRLDIVLEEGWTSIIACVFLSCAFSLCFWFIFLTAHCHSLYTNSFFVFSELVHLILH